MERKEKFTPGPWRLTAHNRNILIYHRRDIDVGLGQIVAIIECPSDEVVENAVANARLIAAAPEMYECICDALTDLEMSVGMRAHFEAVLKKARGEA